MTLELVIHVLKKYDRTYWYENTIIKDFTFINTSMNCFYEYLDIKYKKIYIFCMQYECMMFLLD
jgi:hypothetical protein